MQNGGGTILELVSESFPLRPRMLVLRTIFWETLFFFIFSRAFCLENDQQIFSKMLLLFAHTDGIQFT